MRCKLTSSEINLSFFRDECDLENEFWFMITTQKVLFYSLKLTVLNTFE